MSQSVVTIIIEGSDLFRTGIVEVLSKTRFRVMAAYANLNDFMIIPEYREMDSLLLVGVDGDPGRFLLLLKSVRVQCRNMRVILLSDHFEPNQIMDAIELGVEGYLLRNTVSSEVLVKAMEIVMLGETVLPRRFLHLLCSQGNTARCGTTETCVGTVKMLQPPLGWISGIDLDDAHLTEKERSILRHLTQGASNKLIARELDIGEATVKVHVKAILRKIRVRNRTQAAMWAVNNTTVDRSSANVVLTPNSHVAN